MRTNYWWSCRPRWPQAYFPRSLLLHLQQQSQWCEVYYRHQVSHRKFFASSKDGFTARQQKVCQIAQQVACTTFLARIFQPQNKGLLRHQSCSQQIFCCRKFYQTSWQLYHMLYIQAAWECLQNYLNGRNLVVCSLRSLLRCLLQQLIKRLLLHSLRLQRIFT